jgi:hypothetical protein
MLMLYFVFPKMDVDEQSLLQNWKRKVVWEYCVRKLR